MKVFAFKLGMTGPLGDVRVQPKQGETASTLRITLMDGEPYGLTGAEVNAIFKKSDGTISYIPATVVDAENGIIEVQLTNQILAVPGRVRAEVQITGESGLAKSWTFVMYVQESVGQSDIESVNEIPILEKLIADTVQAEQERAQVFEGYSTRIANMEQSIEEHEHIYQDEGDDLDYMSVVYRLVILNGEPFLEVIEA